MDKPYQKMGLVLPTSSTATQPPQRRTQVRRSGVHGKGVFATTRVLAGERLLEYTGETITWQEALLRHPHDPTNPHHTFYFHIDEHHVIDAKFNGNSARWINHSCAPNCEAQQVGLRVFIHALRDIEAGEELFYDYGLVIDEPLTPQLRADYACWCGQPPCRGTMLTAPPAKRRRRRPA